MPIPVVLLAFANDRAEGGRYLRNLPDERRDIERALDPARRAGVCEVVLLANATAAELLDAFQDPDHRDRVAVFHYAGHADSYALLLETGAGAPHLSDGGGLAAFLGRQRGLQLVSLNACATRGHVRALRDAGVPAVIATERPVEDAIARDFAVRLFHGLGGGAGVRRAFDEATDAVRLAHAARRGGPSAPHPRDLVDDDGAGGSPDAPADVAPWDLHVRPGAERVERWTLAEAAGNPLFGLPALPADGPLPDEPFRHLHPFGAAHAPLFFGRGADIRELYDRVAGADAPPVILLYGQTGVGKSSLLDAGLLPRLAGTHENRYARRDPTLGLVATLARALGVEPAPNEPRAAAAAIADAWRRVERESRLPDGPDGRRPSLLVVVDQVEEAFTEATLAADAGAPELDAFAAVVAALVADPATAPRGRLVLGFRKEWLAEVDGALAAHGVPRTRQFLGRLTRGGVVEAIVGPAREERLRRQYGLTVEPGLAELIADDLLADRESHVAPVLQILLAGMWARATARDASAPRFDVALYDEVRTAGLHLDDFLARQLASLAEWEATTVESGLALDFLAFHTTPLGTAQERSAAEAARAYPHAHPTAAELRAACTRRYLLVERTGDAGDDDRRARLAHDTLAPLVRQRFDDSTAPGPRASFVLASRASDWNGGRVGTPLDEADLAVVERGAPGMRAWTDAERRLVEASRRARDVARRRRARLRLGAAAAVLLVVAAAAVSFALYRRSETQLAFAESRELVARASALDSLHSDVALLLAVAAWRRAPTLEAERALLSHVGADPYLVRRLAASGPVGFARDGGALTLVEGDTIALWDVASGRREGATRAPFDRGERPKVGPDGTLFSAIAAVDTGGPVPMASVAVRELATGRDVGRFTIPRAAYWSVAGMPAAPDAPLRYASADSSAVVLWNVAMGRPLRRLTGLPFEVRWIGFSADGRIVAAADTAGALAAWDAATGRPLNTGVGRLGSLIDLTTSPAGDYLVAVPTAAGALRVDLRDGSRTPLTWGVNQRPAAAVALSADGGLLAFTRRGAAGLAVRDLTTQTVMAELPAMDQPQWLAFAPRGRRLAAAYGGFAGELVDVWDLGGSALATAASVPRGAGQEMVALSTDGRLAAVADTVALAVWDARTRSPSGPPLPLAPASGQPAGFAAAASRLWTFERTDSAAARFVLREVASRRVLGSALVGPAGQSREAGADHDVVSPDGERVALEDGERPMLVHRVTRPARVDSVVDPAARAARGGCPTRPLAFTEDGAVLAFQGCAGRVLLWDVAARQVRDSIVGLSQPAQAAAFSADGAVVAISDFDAVHLYRRGTATRLAEVARQRVPGGQMGMLAVSPDGRRVAFVGDRGKIFLADAPTGQLLGTIAPIRAGLIVQLAFTDGGRRLLVGSSGGYVSSVDMDPARWAEHACRVARSDRARARWARLAPPSATYPERCEAP